MYQVKATKRADLWEKLGLLDVVESRSLGRARGILEGFYRSNHGVSSRKAVFWGGR